MEIYVKLKDVEELLNKLYNEPGYQHTGETFYAGICAVKSDFGCRKISRQAYHNQYNEICPPHM